MKSQSALLDLSNLMAGPGLYPLQVDWAQQQVLFLSVAPDFYANAPFLDQRAVPLCDLCSFWLERREPWSEVSEEGLNQRVGQLAIFEQERF